MYGAMYPRSNCIPATKSTSTPNDCPSSTVITPFSPTSVIAFAIIAPISASFAEMLATFSISPPLIGVAIFLISATIASTPFSIPRRRCCGFVPAVTFRRPSRTRDCASTVAVVVPSPATSFVLLATSFTSSAPRFSSLSSSSISFATVTPSFVTIGAP